MGLCRRSKWLPRSRAEIGKPIAHRIPVPAIGAPERSLHNVAIADFVGEKD